VEPLFLTLEEVLEIHRDEIERYGGTLGVRDKLSPTWYVGIR
jgi:hypothetical protein